MFANWYAELNWFSFAAFPPVSVGLPCQDHVYKTTDESFRFHNKHFDEMCCKLDSTENPRSFEKYPTWRWGWVFLERTRILSGIQFTTHFIESFVVETKRFVSSFVNVILTRQTCGQRSSRPAESKRRALGNYFFLANLLYVPNIKM